MFATILRRCDAWRSRLALWPALRNFAPSRTGVAAVEFAIVAAPFLALMFAIIETGIVFFAGQTLETTAAQASRLIMTGQAQQQNFDEAAFRKAVCDRLANFMSCATVMIDVRSYSTFATANISLPIDANGNLSTSFVYQPGSAGDIVVVRLMYTWPINVTIFNLDKAFAKLANGQNIMMATASFRNEPYQGNGS